MKYRGVITVFLTLMLSVISVFVLMLTRGARSYISRGEAEYAVDNAVRSCFAEYNRELFEKFHILVIDSSYKTAEVGIDRIEEHFSTYLTESLSSNELCSVSVERVGEDGISFDGCILSGEVLDEEMLTEYMRENGSPGFDPDECYTALLFTATFTGPGTGDYTITREYAYDV